MNINLKDKLTNEILIALIIGDIIGFALQHWKGIDITLVICPLVAVLIAINREKKIKRFKTKFGIWSMAMIVMLLMFACNVSKKFKLEDDKRLMLINELKTMDILDQKYRTPISLGTLDSSVIRRADEIGENGTIEEYILFQKSIIKTLSKNQIDSLWVLQHVLDFENYKKLTKIIKKFGYPSSERLQIKREMAFPILLHPPIEVKHQKYLKEMMALLEPEVIQGRMEEMMFAQLVDNMKVKILKQPQIYGTNIPFNHQTGTLDLPKIEDIEETNKLRRKIKLPELKAGEYELMKEINLKRN